MRANTSPPIEHRFDESRGADIGRMRSFCAQVIDCIIGRVMWQWKKRAEEASVRTSQQLSSPIGMLLTLDKHAAAIEMAFGKPSQTCQKGPTDERARYRPRRDRWQRTANFC